jgi:hypothetical protein
MKALLASLVATLALGIGASSTFAEEANVIFKLDSLTTSPGSTVRVPFRVRADTGGITSVSASIDFDEEVLQVVSIEPVFERPDGRPWSVWVNKFENENLVPGNGGVDEEGWIKEGIVFSDDYPVTIPAGTEAEIFAIHFKVKDHVQAENTEIRFQDGAEWGYNAVFIDYDHSEFPEDPEPASVLVGSLLKLVPGGTFRRGDATGDGAADISDPLAILDHLFTGEREVACADAADANDDGQVDMSDPISILSFLFLGEKEIPAPHADCGADPTEDGLACKSYQGC